MEENFDKLKKLLALKKHEQPPPGYFNDFSAKVLARIQAEEQARPQSWWQRLTAVFDARPIMAGAYGIAVIGMLAFAVTVATKGPQPQFTPSIAHRPTVQPHVNEAVATNLIDVDTPSSALIASNDSAPPFLFNPNGIDSNGNTLKTAPVDLLVKPRAE